MQELIPFLFMSHDPEWLFSKLERQVFDPDSLFRKIIITPSALVKDKFHKKLLDKKISMGFKVLELPAAIDYLMRLIHFEDRRNHAFPAPMLLTLHLEAIFYDLIEKKEKFSSYSLEALFKYLSEKNKDQLRAKIQDLSEMLSTEFLRYGMYGSEGLDKWFEKKSWQNCIWEQAFAIWDYPYKLFEQSKVLNPLNIELEIHLFGFSFIPKIYDKFFHKLSYFFQFYEYYLSPCKLFWGDVCSEKERFFLSRLYEKRGVNRKEITELESYLKIGNTLLSNFGKQTQRRFNDILDKEYALEEMFLNHLDFEKIEAESTLLKGLQLDLLEGRFYEENEKTFLKEEDFSLQIHSAPSKRREVEVLLSVLMDLTYRYEIAPSEILVLAPDISEYFPFIYQIFNTQSPFSIEVHDLEVISQSQFLQGFWQILCLEELRWEQKDIFKLFVLVPFLKKLEITQEEVSQIKKWCETAQIKWGYNHQHRNEKIGLIDSEEKMLEDSEIGTWKYGLERLLFGLTSIEQEGVLDREEMNYFPLQEVDMTQAKLLGDFIQVIHNLYEEVRCFSYATLSLFEWVNLFKKVAETYFLIEEPLEKQAFDFFIEQLKTLLQLHNKIVDKKYPFSSLKRYFEKAFRKKGGSFSDSNKEAICFASLKSQQLYPVKILYILGMEEDSFPRALQNSPLREIVEAEMDFFPKVIEEDRQLLLDALVYTKEHLIISYCSMDSRDGKEKNPSFLVEEILQYCDERYRYLISNKKPSEKIKHSHKSIAFHEEELSKDNPFFRFSMRDYQLGEYYYHREKHSPDFIPEFYTSNIQEPFIEDSSRLEYKVSLQDLKVFARNPLQHYFNHVLGVYLRKEESYLECLEGEFMISSLDKALFRIENLDKDFIEAYERMNLLGELPLGVFKDVAKDQLQEERELLLKHFLAFGIKPSEIMTIELNNSCLKPFQKDSSNWIVPSLKISLEDGTIFYVEGLLENISKEGLVFYGKDSFQDTFKIWPIYLVFRLIVSKYFSEKIKTQLLFAKEGVIKEYKEEDEMKALERYFTYYKKAKFIPSPLFPAWSETVLLKSKEEVAKVIKKSFISDMQFLDDYQKWSFEHLQPFCAHALHDLWHEDLEKTFKPLVSWYEKEVNNA